LIGYSIIKTGPLFIMKIYTNERLINRNRRIGQITTVLSLAVLGLGLFLSFQGSTQLITFSFLALILGFILSQIGIFMGNRFGRRPRLDEVLDGALKGLDDKYSLLHYVAPVSHLLLGPAGIWVLLPYPQGGTISFQNNRWRQKGGNIYLKIFAQEGLGRPDLEVNSNTTDLQSFLEKSVPEEAFPPIQAVLVFTNDKATINIEDTPTPTLPIKKLKDFIRKAAKDTPASMDKITQVLRLFTIE
jgi:hypothetical protein